MNFGVSKMDEPVYRVEKQTDEKYLGDGVYASYDGWYIWLRVERDGGNERVALEPPVYHALQDYADTLGIHPKENAD